MKLKDLLYKVDVRLGSDSVDNILINKVEFDSRKIQKDDLFIAIKGNQLDGHDFIEQAIKNGAFFFIFRHFLFCICFKNFN